MGKARRRKLEPAESEGQAAAPAPRRWTSGGGVRALAGPLCLLVLGWALYANSFAVPFLFDDYFEITSNPATKIIAPLHTYLQRSRGIPSFTFALNYAVAGFDVWGYHLVNVVVHLLNGLLVYALVLTTLRLPAFGERYRRHARVLATLVAAVFLAHPLQTMAATYIVQRAESIASMFYLITVLCFITASTRASGARRMMLYCLAAISAVLGVISKEIVATVPVALMLYSICFLSTARAGSRLRWAALAAMLVLPLGYGVILASPYLFPDSESLVGAVPRAWLYIPTAGFQAEGVGVDWRGYLLTQFKVILWYVRLFVLPTAQCFDYGWPFVDGPWRADVLGPLAVLLAAVGVGIYAFWRYPLATFCIGWFFITLAPSSSVVPLRDAAFEQRMYLPIIGLAWLVVVGGYDLLGRLAARLGRPARSFWQAAGVVAAVWIALLGVATVVRNEVMADPLRLAADSVAKSPANWRAQYAYGDALSQQKRLDEAMVALEESIRLDPEQGSPRVLLSSIYVSRQRYDDAERILIPATALLEDSVVAAAYQQLGTVYQARGEYARAEEALQLAVKYKPKWWSLQRQLGALYARQRNWLMAARHYDQALRLNPERAATLAPIAAQASYNAALGMLSRGQKVWALSLLRRVLELQPEMTPARHQLAVLLAADGAWDEAQTHMERVARAQPGDPLVQENLRRAGAHEPLQAPPTQS